MVHTHGRWRNQESPCNTADGKSDELRGHDYEPLVKEAVRLVVVDALDGDDVGLSMGCSLMTSLLLMMLIYDEKEKERQRKEMVDVRRRLTGSRRLP